MSFANILSLTSYTLLKGRLGFLSVLFIKNWCSDSSTSHVGINEISAVLSTFFVWHEYNLVHEIMKRNLFIASFVKAILYLGAWITLYPYFPHLLSDLGENWCKEGCIFLMAIETEWQILVLLKEAIWHFKSEECLGKVCYITQDMIGSLIDCGTRWWYGQLHASATLLQEISPSISQTGGWMDPYASLDAVWDWFLFSWPSSF